MSLLVFLCFDVLPVNSNLIPRDRAFYNIVTMGECSPAGPMLSPVMR